MMLTVETRQAVTLHFESSISDKDWPPDVKSSSRASHGSSIISAEGGCVVQCAGLFAHPRFQPALQVAMVP
jgi:hypothetical protein